MGRKKKNSTGDMFDGSAVYDDGEVTMFEKTGEGSNIDVEGILEEDVKDSVIEVVAQKEEPSISTRKNSKKYDVVLVASKYIVIDNNGNNQRINGDFSNIKVGDKFSL